MAAHRRRPRQPRRRGVGPHPPHHRRLPRGAPHPARHARAAREAAPLHDSRRLSARADGRREQERVRAVHLRRRADGADDAEGGGRQLLAAVQQRAEVHDLCGLRRPAPLPAEGRGLLRVLRRARRRRGGRCDAGGRARAAARGLRVLRLDRRAGEPRRRPLRAGAARGEPRLRRQARLRVGAGVPAQARALALAVGDQFPCAEGGALVARQRQGRIGQLRGDEVAPVQGDAAGARGGRGAVGRHLRVV